MSCSANANVYTSNLDCLLSDVLLNWSLCSFCEGIYTSYSLYYIVGDFFTSSIIKKINTIYLTLHVSRKLAYYAHTYIFWNYQLISLGTQGTRY